MSFKSVLQHIEEGVVAGAKVASEFYPVLSPLLSMIPRIGPKAQQVAATGVGDLQILANLSQDAQATFAILGQQVPGSQKAALMAPKISVLMQDVEVLGGQRLSGMIKDETEWNAAMQDMAMAVGRALKAAGK